MRIKRYIVLNKNKVVYNINFPDEINLKDILKNKELIFLKIEKKVTRKELKKLWMKRWIKYLKN